MCAPVLLPAKTYFRCKKKQRFPCAGRNINYYYWAQRILTIFCNPPLLLVILVVLTGGEI